MDTQLRRHAGMYMYPRLYKFRRQLEQSYSLLLQLNAFFMHTQKWMK